MVCRQCRRNENRVPSYHRAMARARYKLTLYVTPDSSGKALADLYRALSELAYNDYELDMVDVVEQPDKAKQAGIIGTPTLVYHAEEGDKVIMRVSDIALVRKTLGLPPPS